MKNSENFKNTPFTLKAYGSITDGLWTPDCFIDITLLIKDLSVEPVLSCSHLAAVH